jgi:hypothetical protein
MAAPRVGEQLVVQDPLEGPEQDSGQVAVGSSNYRTYLTWSFNSKLRILLKYS